MTMGEIIASRPEHLRRCGVPNEIVKVLAEPRDTAARRELQGNSYRDVLLCGGVGCGKTVAACELIAQHYEEYRPFLHEPGDLPVDYRWKGALFAPLADFVNRSLWDEEDRDFRDRAAATSLLVLDDVGTERGDGASAVTALLTSRIAQGRRTILTTNLTPEAFERRYGSRVISRIKGTAGHILNVHGPDLRKVGT